ncbi:hypothetical protein L798_05297 [Zootermopsis nevadensis]|uniref:Uncharacterized protein n=1 Tax=Zootermopsis nevadensis TaxID=136037 RepID=A0A067RHJ7_ZOONE|nr:hypothetical protein L798_05297 [Zootermopsis nevadensis]
MIIAKPAHTIPRTLAEKLLGVPVYNGERSCFQRTPQANQMALERLRASSSVASVLASLKRPKGENLSSK